MPRPQGPKSLPFLMASAQPLPCPNPPFSCLPEVPLHGLQVITWEGALCWLQARASPPFSFASGAAAHIWLCTGPRESRDEITLLPSGIS